MDLPKNKEQRSQKSIEKSKLILLLSSLDQKEMDRLDAFLASPYHNKDEEVLRLFRYLKHHQPHYPTSALIKRAVYAHILPGTPYDDKHFRYVMSDLNKKCEAFLALQEMEQQPYLSQLALLECLSSRGLEKNYRQVNRSLQQSLEKRQGDSTEYFMAQFKWAATKERHFERKRLRRFDENIQIASTQLDRYYFLNRLRISCAMLNRQTIIQANYELNLSSEWVEHLEQQAFFDEPIIQLYYTIYKALLEEGQEQHFTALRGKLAQEAPSIPFHDLREIYLFAINYCARKIRQGKNAYVEQALQLYRSGIESYILIEDNVLSPWTFTNVVKLSLRTQQYDWIEGFIAEYAPLLPESFRENALHYNLAELYYYTGRYDKAQSQLNDVAFSDLNYYLGARVLLAKIYYETDAEEPLLALIASFSIFLKRNKELSSELKHTYLNFCHLLFQIVRRPPEKLDGIQEKIEHTALLTDRSWLKQICTSAAQ